MEVGVSSLRQMPFCISGVKYTSRTSILLNVRRRVLSRMYSAAKTQNNGFSVFAFRACAYIVGKRKKEPTLPTLPTPKGMSVGSVGSVG
jgi:hypothetical protein